MIPPKVRENLELIRQYQRETEKNMRTAIRNLKIVFVLLVAVIVIDAAIIIALVVRLAN